MEMESDSSEDASGSDGGPVPVPSATTAPSAQAANADLVAALKKVSAKIERNEQGEVVEVNLGGNTQITDAGLANVKGLTQLQSLNLNGTKITDAGLEHLKGLANLQTLDLEATRVTNAGIADLKKALPNCKISM